MGGPVPSNYLTLAEIVEEESKRVKSAGEKFPVMQHHRLEQLMKTRGLFFSKEELQQAIRFLHDTGIVLHYTDVHSKLSDLYFLDPEWLCQLMGRIISIPEVNPVLRARQGVSCLFMYVGVSVSYCGCVCIIVGVCISYVGVSISLWVCIYHCECAYIICGCVDIILWVCLYHACVCPYHTWVCQHLVYGHHTSYRCTHGVLPSHVCQIMYFYASHKRTYAHTVHMYACL